MKQKQKQQSEVSVVGTDFATVKSETIQRLWDTLPTHRRVIAKTPNGEEIWGTYIKAPDLLRRLQEMFGLNYQIHFSQQYFVSPDERDALFVVQCSITVMYQDGTETTVSDFGTAFLMRNGKLNENAPKAAATDAFKRAIRWLGIGMFQYDDEAVPEVLRTPPSSDNGEERRIKRSNQELEAAVAELFATQSDSAETAYEVMEELDLVEAEDDSPEDTFVRLSKVFKATPKQLVWLFRDTETGSRWLDAFAEGKTASEFLNAVFAERKTAQRN